MTGPNMPDFAAARGGVQVTGRWLVQVTNR